MKVRFVASDRAGGGHLRSIWPAWSLREAGIDAVADVHFPTPSEYDTIIMHRPMQRDYAKRVERYKAAGVRVLIDEDDDLYSVPESNLLAHQILAANGGLLNHERAVAASDGVTVSTPALRDQYRAQHDNVYLCPNYLPGGVWRTVNPKPLHRHPGTQAIVSWCGITKTHRDDLRWLAPYAPLAFRGASFHTVGGAGDTLRAIGLQGQGIPMDTVEFQADIRVLYEYMAGADVGIVPLVPNQFNRAKSWLKALEYMTQGVPVVATKLPEQEALITHGHDGFLAETPKQMAEYVQQLVHDPSLRYSMGAMAKARTKELALEAVTPWPGVIDSAKVPAGR